MPIGGAKSAKLEIAEDGEEIQIPKKSYNLDDLGEDAFGGPPPSSAPKKGPPARFAKNNADDEEMKEETAPVRKPVPKAKEEEKKVPAKPAAAGKTPAATTAGGAKGPSIQEENVGEGLSKEEAEARFIETFAPEIVENLEDSKKWNEK